MHRLTRFSARLSLASLALATLAFAQGAPPPPAPPPARGGACRADIAALCPNLTPGKADHRAIAECLMSQQDKVSAPCKTEMEQMKAKMEAAKEACQPDVDKFCSTVAKGGGQVMQCLKQHESELSDACKAAQPKQHKGPPAPPPAQ